MTTNPFRVSKIGINKSLRVSVSEMISRTLEHVYTRQVTKYNVKLNLLKILAYLDMNKNKSNLTETYSCSDLITGLLSVVPLYHKQARHTSEDLVRCFPNVDICQHVIILQEESL